MIKPSWKSVALVLSGILLGCVAGAAGSAVGQLPPPPGVQAPPAGVPRYEYTCLKEVSARIWEPEAMSALNRMGSQGWHLLPPRFAVAGPGSYMDIYCFERPAP
jgi:hypothetical protein